MQYLKIAAQKYLLQYFYIRPNCVQEFYSVHIFKLSNRKLIRLLKAVLVGNYSKSKQSQQ